MEYRARETTTNWINLFNNKLHVARSVSGNICKLTGTDGGDTPAWNDSEVVPKFTLKTSAVTAMAVAAEPRRRKEKPART